MKATFGYYFPMRGILLAAGLTSLVVFRRMLSIQHYLGSMTLPIFGDIFLKRVEVAHKHNVNEFLDYTLSKRTA